MNQKIKVAINGFGRIGRTTFRLALEHPEIEVVAINDLSDPKILAGLLKYDSNYGELKQKVSAKKNSLIVGGKETFLFKEKEPEKLPWKKLNVEVVLECTGRFTSTDDCKPHLKAGAKKVIISAPASSKGGSASGRKDKKTPIYMIGVNEHKYRGEAIISMGSCTTNCIAPIMKLISQKFGVLKSQLTTVHSYTSDQRLLDNDHKDLRRARSAAINIIPTTTGAALATTQALPELEKLFDGLAVRVPTPVVSLSDITVVTKKRVSEAKVNELFRKAAAKELKKVLAVINKPLVSSDFKADSHSAIVDLSLTKVVAGDLLKIIAWYDNEWGYSNRLVEMVSIITSK